MSATSMSPILSAKRASWSSSAKAPSSTMPTIRLLAVSGSLRKASTNTALLGAASLLAPEGMAVELYDGLGGLPHFNPDIDIDPLPATVTDLRTRVGAA